MTLQSVFKRGETRYYDFISERVSLVIDLYDFDNFKLPDGKAGNYYTRKRKLTKANFLK